MHRLLLSCVSELVKSVHQAATRRDSQQLLATRGDVTSVDRDIIPAECVKHVVVTHDTVARCGRVSDDLFATWRATQTRHSTLVDSEGRPKINTNTLKINTNTKIRHTGRRKAHDEEVQG